MGTEVLGLLSDAHLNSNSKELLLWWILIVIKNLEVFKVYLNQEFFEKSAQWSIKIVEVLWPNVSREQRDFWLLVKQKPEICQCSQARLMITILNAGFSSQGFTVF